MLVNLEQIVGRQDGALAISVTDSEYQHLQDRICKAVEQVDEGSGVIVMTDIHGSSSCNLCKMACNDCDHVIISGINMPMLIKLTRVRRKRLSEAARMVTEAGRHYITIVE